MAAVGRGIRGALRRLKAVLGLVALLGAGVAGADPGLDWLAAQQQPDGSHGATPTSLATPAQSTAEVLRAQLALEQRAAAGFERGLGFLNALAGTHTELLAHKLAVNAQLGLAAPVPVFPLLTQLYAAQHRTGGFGARPGTAPSVLDTAVALEALSLGAAPTAPEVGRAVGFLLARQQTSGAWVDGDNEPSVFLTAQVARALRGYHGTFAGVSTALTRAQSFLLSRKGAEGLWGEDFRSAAVLLALAPLVSDLSLLEASAQALQARQQADGSWVQDAYTTALALQALYAYEARRGGGSAEGGGSIAGYVLRAGSTEPIAGATVSVEQVPGVAVVTNGEGYYVLPALPVGSYTVTAQKSGHTPAGAVVATRAGQLTLAPPLVLDLAADTGLVSGLVFDAATRQPLQAVQVSLTGAASRSVLTNAAGTFDFGPVAPGTYTLRVEKSGYLALGGTATVEAGRTLYAQLGLTQAGGYVDASPAAIGGRVVDAKTGQPLAGARFDLGAGLAATSAADGTFSIAAVPRGTYQGTLSAAGYRTATLTLPFVAGASGELGTLSLFPESATTPPTSLTLRGLVAHGVTGAALPGATVTLLETGASAITGPDGRFVLEGITLKSFRLAVGAAGFEPATYGLQVAAFGEADVTLKLSPPGDGATVSQLAGLVKDAASGEPLAGAQVAVVGTSLTAMTGSDGRYALAGISSLELVVSISAVGFTQQQLGVRLAAHGSYTLDAALSPVAGESFQIVSVAAQAAEYGPGTTALFSASVASLLGASQAVLVLGEVQDAAGQPVATVRPYAQGTTTPTSVFSFEPGELKQLTIPWDTQQFAPGTYRLVLRVAEADSVSQGLPSGRVLAENAARTRVVAGLALAGAMALDPPISQAGLPTPVSFSALVKNAGNVPLAAGSYVLTVQSAKTGDTLFSAEAPAEALPVGNHLELAFGSWVPTEAGNLPVTVRSRDPAVPGALTHTLYVGDKASGLFTVSRTLVPEGDQTVRGNIHLQGVDVTQGGSTDPLFVLVKESVKRAGAYTGKEAVAWHASNQCLGCHIQTQSLLGLSSALQKAEVDLAATRYLFNAVSSSQMSDGALRISHPEYTETQTALGLWSLSDWADASSTFRTRYRAAQHLQARRVRSGTHSYWTPDHASGWWNTYASHTALVVKGYVDVLASAQALPAGGVTDYALQAGVPLGAGTRPEGMAVGPDGHLYVAKYNSGVIVRMNLETGETSTFASGVGNVYGLAFDAAGALYYSRNASTGALTRINADGSRTALPVGGNLTDVLAGPDGWLYLADWNGQRILRLNPVSNAVETYASGGLLNRPYGLALDADGNLLVANYQARNILRIAQADRSVSRFADGLAYPPLRMMRATDGSLYATTDSVEGLLRIRTDGTAERVLHSSTNLQGVVAHQGRLYVGDYTANTLRELQLLPLATADLATFRDELPYAVRYLLANNDSDNDNVVHAQRLIGLAEARRVLTDAALLAQIEARVASEAALLRARQKVNGGWSRYTYDSRSDPLATSMVGIALEYTNPSPKDLQIRNAIQYLLNTQRADGSWDNFNNGLGTRLASTSFVMVFMPKALERLGGIDIDLYVETPGNIQLANASAAPTSTPLAGGLTRHLWQLPGVTGQGREVAFDLRLLAMALGEQRPAATRAYLEFKNSFVDGRIELPLEVPVVSVTSGATLEVATDRVSYLPDEQVAISATVANTSQLAQSGRVALAIRAVGATEPVAILPALPYAGLAPGAQLVLSTTWSTGTTLAGDYEVAALLLDPADRALDDATSAFAIRAPLPLATTAVTTDRPEYGAWDAVAITGRVRNVAPNALLQATRATVTVYAPDGATVFTAIRSLNELPPGGLADLPFGLKLADAVGGPYRVLLVLEDAFTRERLSSSETAFQVLRQTAASLSGTVTVQWPSVYVGDPNSCTSSARSAAASGVPGVRLIHQVMSAETGEVVRETAETVDLVAGTPHTAVHAVPTQGLALGGYVCLLQAELDGTRRTLAMAGFQVLEPPIRFTATLAQQGRGRLLVLLDDPGGADGSAEPYGPEAAPDLGAQRAFLEELLTRAGWSYTVTQTAADFTRELRTGGYAAYALFAEREKLAVQVQGELREAVFRGEGLLVSGSHDSRNHGNEAALGVKFIGHLYELQGVALASPQFPLLGGTLPLLAQEKPLRLELSGAESLGHYTPEQSTGHAALTLHGYGHGTAAFSGPDLLAIATRDGQEGLAASVLRALLERVHPEALGTAAGSVVPVQLEVANQGVAVSVAAALPLPAGAAVVDAGGGTLDGQTLRFAFPLAEGQTRSLRFWLRLPDAAGPLTLGAEVSASQGSQVKVQSVSLTLGVSAVEALSSVLPRVEDLARSEHPEAKAFMGAATHLRNALKRSPVAQAVGDVLLATDRLEGATSAEALELRAAIGAWLRWALQQPS